MTVTGALPCRPGCSPNREVSAGSGRPRRFLRHVLPKAFLRIRHYGLLANRRKGELLERCRTLLGVVKPAPPADKTTPDWILQLLGIDVTRCPVAEPV